MSKYTKGPWRVIKRGPCGPACYSFWIAKDHHAPEWRGPSNIGEVINLEECHEMESDGTHKKLCEMSGKHDEAEANANLMAAAPEMLEALEWVETQIVIKNVNAPDTLKRVQEAIKKAKGEK